MADTKISGLPASTTPLAGTEVLPIVQSGTTKQVSVANLTAGRAISATELTLTTGNLIVSSGKGIDFSATPGTGTSELLADYEEGTFTVTDQSGAGLTFVQAPGVYTKVGRQVFCQMAVTYPVTASAANAILGGLPFTINNGSGVAGRAGGNISVTDSAAVGILLLESTTTLWVYNGAFVRTTNANLSNTTLYIACQYIV